MIIGQSGLPDLAADLPAVEHGKHDIEQHEVGRYLLEELDRVRSVMSYRYLVALFFKIKAK